MSCLSGGEGEKQRRVRGILGFLNKVPLAMLSLQKPLGPLCSRVRIWAQRGGPRGVELWSCVNIPDKSSIESALLSFSHISKMIGILPESCYESSM